ncbi:hypothetical protein RHGRI_035410 [Rhododendron griersonianum]|uniref:V-SNARE coiled-coil homology domain-containing protein n=1 Tax=Rhododendron griersonianum TaxID=479676 RepID=A0AAV6I4G3_9ERIC|nr:hypothetical protein RHGRI_035410 [Rhododendron griersonianum]
MTRNVQEVLGVGEKLDQVSEMSSRLTSESRIYADKAKDLNRQLNFSLFTEGFDSEVGPCCHCAWSCLPSLLDEKQNLVMYPDCFSFSSLPVMYPASFSFLQPAGDMRSGFLGILYGWEQSGHLGV